MRSSTSKAFTRSRQSVEAGPEKDRVVLIVAGLSLKNLEPRVWDPESPFHLPTVAAVMVSYAEFHQMPARRAAAMGIEGKWAIHPSQIVLANEIFTPTMNEVERARRIVAALAEAKRQGKGAVTMDGRMIDAASIRQAEALLKKAVAIAGR